METSLSLCVVSADVAGFWTTCYVTPGDGRVMWICRDTDPLFQSQLACIRIW